MNIKTLYRLIRKNVVIPVDKWLIKNLGKKKREELNVGYPDYSFREHFSFSAFCNYIIDFRDLKADYRDRKYWYWFSIANIIHIAILSRWEPEIYEWHVRRREWQHEMFERYFSFDFVYLLIEVLCFILPILIAVAFTTLLERKVLAAMQRRVGPNYVGYKGFGQPFADALKLLLKEMVVPSSSSRTLFLMAPMFTLLLSIMTWFVVPMSWHGSIIDIHLGLAYIFALSSLGVYSIILARLV